MRLLACALLLTCLGCPPSEPVPPPPSSDPAPVESKRPPPTIDTSPLKIGVGGPRNGELRPKNARLVLRKAADGEVQVFLGDELLGGIRKGDDGKYSGSGFAAAIERGGFWIKTQVVIAREPEVPLEAVQALGRGLMVGGAMQQTFEVLGEGSPPQRR